MREIAALAVSAQPIRSQKYSKGEYDMNFVLAVMIRIKPENVEQFMAQALANGRETRKEPGCRQFEVLVDAAERTKVMLFEIYDDEKAFEAHQQTPHFKKYATEAVPLLESRERHMLQRALP
jgi:quinol monooxygenase YgiN